MSTVPSHESGFRSSWLQFLKGVSSSKKHSGAPLGSHLNSLLVPQLVATWASEKRSSYAITSPTETLSYGELEAESNALARYLLSLGANSETPVALFMERSPALLIGALGVMKAGAPYLPLDPSYPAERISLILNDARVQIVLTSSGFHQSLPPGLWIAVDLSNPRMALSAYSAATVAFTLEPSQLAYVIYTSGS